MSAGPGHWNYPPPIRGRIVVWGYLASYPFGGMTWQVLHYLVALRELGFDVWYVEDTDAEVRDPQTLWETRDVQPNVAHLRRWMECVGLSDRWVFRLPGVHDQCVGALDVDGLSGLYRDADAVMNLCGSHELRAMHDWIRCLIYLETDPVPRQVAVARGDVRVIAELERYQYLFTYGENLEAADCSVPVARYSWNRTRPPVIVDWWACVPVPPRNAAFTTVTSWTHTWNDVAWNGERWRWSKHHEFVKFRDLPRHCHVPLEIAVRGMSDPCAQSFRETGWRIRPASAISDPDEYRSYIRGSLGEFTVAKEQYVKPRTGWFSDRSVCYLAAGRPVVTQETGFSKFIPCGEGLFGFSTFEEAAERLDAITLDYQRHSRAATAVAREYFDARAVVRRVVETIGLA